MLTKLEIIEYIYDNLFYLFKVFINILYVNTCDSSKRWGYDLEFGWIHI